MPISESERGNYDDSVMKSDLTRHVINGSFIATNPTKVNYVTAFNNTGSPITINPGGSRSIFTTSTVYDCTSRIYNDSTNMPGGAIYTLNGQQWYGYKESKKGKIEQELSDKLTVLAHEK